MTSANEVEFEKLDTRLPANIGTDWNFKRKIVWFNAIGFLILHLLALYSYTLVPKANANTTIYALLTALFSGMGVTAGAHRYWSHRAYKATFMMRLVLIIFHTIAGQNCLYIWVRDHRQHHKFSDTDADPHNANRGFFFSHVGWLMSKKHPMVIEKGKTIDMRDLDADELVMFQKKYYKPLYVLFALILPIATPYFMWNETLINSVFISYFGRYMLVLNITWLVNSAAHLYGNKPFDKFMKPAENKFVSVVSVGEGWHNYHHAFPWDYRAAELGEHYSLTTLVIDVCAYFGWAYDLKQTPYHMSQGRSLRTGDGTHPVYLKESKYTYVPGHEEDEEQFRRKEEEIEVPINGKKINGLLDRDARIRSGITKG